MDNFTFHERPALQICGKEYPVDMCDTALVTALVTNFPAITAQAEKLQALNNKALAAVQDPEGAVEIVEKMTEENRTLCAQSRAFITAAIGEDGLAEVFKGRRVNSADLVQLAAHIYAGVLEYRTEQMRPYLHTHRSKEGRRGIKTSSKPHGKK